MHDKTNPIDYIDKVLDCIKLFWQTMPGKANSFSTSKEYGLIPLDIIRVSVHIVRRDFFLAHTDGSANKTGAATLRFQNFTVCEAEQFYVNRFHKIEQDTLWWVNSSDWQKRTTIEEQTIHILPLVRNSLLNIFPASFSFFYFWHRNIMIVIDQVFAFAPSTVSWSFSGIDKVQ